MNTIGEYLAKSILIAKLFKTNTAQKIISICPEPEKGEIPTDDEKKIFGYSPTPSNINLLMLYAVGVIKNYKLMLYNLGEEDISECIEKCVNKVWDINEETAKSTDDLSKAFLLSINYVRHGILQDMDFDDILNYITTTQSEEIQLEKGFFHPNDEFFNFLYDIGEELAECTFDNDELIDNINPYKRNIDSRPQNTNDNRKLSVICFPERAIIFQKIYKKSLAVEYGKYANEFDLEVSEEGFEQFVNETVAKFEITALKRAHRICLIPNYYDYKNTSLTEDDKIVEHDVEVFSETVRLSGDDCKNAESIDVLCKLALEQMVNANYNETNVFIIRNRGRKYVYGLDSDKKFVSIDSKSFFTEQFDFIKIWKGIRRMDAEKATYIQNNKIVLDFSKYFPDVPEKQYDYIRRILSEQVAKAKKKQLDEKLNKARIGVGDIIKRGFEKKELLNTTPTLNPDGGSANTPPDFT